MLLSDRMQAVVGLVTQCDCIADIGCDHGYVAIELMKRGLCKHVIAMDVNKGPLAHAIGNIESYCMSEYIETRLSNGTQALAKGEANGIICAGMGGKLIISILEEGREVISDMEQLILQPQSEIDEVREYLRNSGFIIEKEDMICEDGKYYPMMRVLTQNFGKQEVQMADNLCEKKKKNVANGENIIGLQPPSLSEMSVEEATKITRVQDTYGPCLLANSHPILKQYLLWKKENLENIRSNLINQKQQTMRQQYRISELDTELSDIVFCLYSYFKI